MQVSDATSLPPRSALPRDIEIPALPELGRTWYARGGKYWAGGPRWRSCGGWCYS
jgi:hypothetical protein